MLFDERNFRNVVFKLNGNAEMFYRRASIEKDERIVHPANQRIKNKNPESQKEYSIFEYDLIKDRRYAEHSYMLHFPITLNFKAAESDFINDKVRATIRKCEDNYVIGIDRGERNLIYICVIDGHGNIVEQLSLNEIINEYNGIKHITDYHKLLDDKETERDVARQNWTAIENIKELKEGYISQVVHKICELVEKYDAIIAMEDLNSGFKNSRLKIEKQVYQKFENQLIDKFNFMVDKKRDPELCGGLLNAYQLACRDFNNHGVQNGFIFYVPAWLTSKIDPVTGFVNLINPIYTSVQAAKELFDRFKSIRYNLIEDIFEFDIDYNDFPKGSTSFRKVWTICSNGERIKSFRNSAKNGEWDNEVINLTGCLKELFEKFDIKLDEHLKDSICNQNKKEFFEELIRLLRLILQMRNSVTGCTDIDYIISPVKDSKGQFYDSRNYQKCENPVLPKDADANGAYNIARKALYMIDIIKNSDEEKYVKAKLSITNKEWLEYAQNND